ncbi:MAG: sulfurtransferase TusA family protein [Deltaproteobacteria bacterium]|jgi:TusA-related sulfurtransferase|nr:MAG: sulfurtransferase TusA family protein [Deltaproteobacteria bacterium]
MKKIKTIKVGDSHYQVDMRGWMCPYPKYAVEPLIQKLEDNSRMDMLVDCPSATQDVPRVVRAMGCKVSEVSQIGTGEWRIVIVK